MLRARKCSRAKTLRILYCRFKRANKIRRLATSWSRGFTLLMCSSWVSCGLAALSIATWFRCTLNTCLAISTWIRWRQADLKLFHNWLLATLTIKSALDLHSLSYSDCPLLVVYWLSSLGMTRLSGCPCSWSLLRVVSLGALWFAILVRTTFFLFFSALQRLACAIFRLALWPSLATKLRRWSLHCLWFYFLVCVLWPLY